MVEVGRQSSRRTVRLLVLYGVSGNAQELLSISGELEQHPDVPTMIMGDLNTPATDEVWRVLQERGFWRDLHVLACDSEQPAPTCFTEKPPVWTTVLLVASLRGADQDLTCSFPTHVPITVTIDCQLASLSVLRLPLQMPSLISGPKPLPQDLVAMQDLFQADLLEGNLDHAYERWSSYWERWMAEHASEPITRQFRSPLS